MARDSPGPPNPTDGPRATDSPRGVDHPRTVDHSRAVDGPVVDAQPVERVDWRAQYAVDRKVTREVWSAMEIIPYRERLDTPDRAHDGKPDTPRAELERFDPRRGGLAEISTDEAADYIANADLEQKPWLAPAMDAAPQSKRVLAALDTGDGHAPQRHEGWIRPAMTHDRSAKLVDPAVPNPEDRAPGKDAYKGKTHACGIDATSIVDPDAFAVAYVRAIEHPKVSAILDGPFDPEKGRVTDVALDDLLGPDSAQYCSGHRLDPVDGDMNEARGNRKAWVRDIRAGETPTVPEPTASPLRREAFEGARMQLAFKPNRAKTGYELSTMYVKLRADQPRGARP